MAQKHVYSHTPSKAPAQLLAEREHVALLHRHVHPVASRQPPRLGHRRVGKIKRGDPIPMTSQQARIVTTPRPRNRNPRHDNECPPTGGVRGPFLGPRI